MTIGRHHISQCKDWGTPLHYIEAVRKVFRCNISLDPCSNKYSLVDADTEYMLPEVDGLHASWDFDTIYVNPPYGIDKIRGTRIKDWFRKCVETQLEYATETIALVPVATNTSHWKEYVFGRATAVCFLSDTRLKFLVDGEEGGKGAPMACAMVYWGIFYHDFHEVFNKFGAVVDLRSMKED